ncbi:MAG: outer membrane beta-barrel protein [Desulfuromonadales bacterium]|nr:outer membrane beta-barrel protein [Desulfuromonadales bacterium]
MLSLDHSRSLLCLTVFSLLAALAIGTPVAAAGEYQGLTYFQGLVGAASLDENKLTFAEPDLNDPDAMSTNDLSTMPYLGIAGQYAFAGTESHIGVDASLLIGWRSDDTSISAGNAQTRIEIDSELWLVDLAIGLYAQTVLGNRWRLYGAVGPMMLFGEYSDDTTAEDLTVTPMIETRDSYSESVFGVGGYAKAGVEYRIAGDAYLGITVRGIATNAEFDRAIEDGGLSGVQGFVTFTRGY